VTIADARLYRYRLPLTEPLPVGGHTLTERRGLLLRLTDDGGNEGWGEAAPLPGFSPESLGEATSAARALMATLVGRDVPDTDLDALLRSLPAADGAPSVRFAREGAVVELRATGREGSVTRVLGGTADPVALNALITVADADLDAAADRVRQAGYRAVKMKVGRADVEDDVRRVQKLSAALGEDVGLRLDANRKWTWEQAVAFAKTVEDVPIEYVEEPLRNPANLPEFANRTTLPLALDETTRECDPEDLPADLPVRAVVLKPTLLGGIAEARRWAGWARERNAEPVVSASYESGVGLRMLVALAGSLSTAPAGLSTYARLADDVLRPRLPLGGATARVEQVYASHVDRFDLLTPID
jgi:O-succinylbenzoate synthase